MFKKMQIAGFATTLIKPVEHEIHSFCSDKRITATFLSQPAMNIILSFKT